MAHTHKQIVRIWNNRHRIRFYAKIENRIWEKTPNNNLEGERERRKVVSVPYTRQHSPRRLKKRDSCYATLTATLIVCCCCCGCLGRVWKPVMPMFGVCFHFLWQSNTACYCAFRLKIEADAQDVSYRIVCNWHVNKMKSSECTTHQLNRFVDAIRASALSLETILTDAPSASKLES